MRSHLHCSAAGLLVMAITATPHAFASSTALERAKELRIFFAHQSVGQNVLDGLERAGLKVFAGRAPMSAPGVEHSLVGRNGEPLTKFADFERLLEEAGPGIDVALMELCYVDFSPDTDAAALFAEYQRLHSRLVARFPAVTILHVTAALTTAESGLKGWVKHALGGAARGERENAEREAFNELLRATYADAPLFDLARLEATRPDGRSQTFEWQGRQVRALAPEYTDDGGHLNAAGQRVMAAALIDLLGELKSRRP